MRALQPLLLALTATFALAACAAAPPTTSGEPMSSSPAAPVASDSPAPKIEEPAMTCDAKMGQWAEGKLADEALVAKVRADTGSERVRVIKPGMAVTMDYREDRLNLDVDADNRVTAVRCG